MPQWVPQSLAFWRLALEPNRVMCLLFTGNDVQTTRGCLHVIKLGRPPRVLQ